MLGLRPFTLLGLALLAYLAQPSKKPALKYTALASTHPEGPPFPIWVEIFLENASLGGLSGSTDVITLPICCLYNIFEFSSNGLNHNIPFTPST